jgi:hypothetical protein
MTLIGDNSTATPRTHAMGSPTEANTWNLTIRNGSAAVTVTGVVKNLTFESTYTGALANSAISVYGDFTLVSQMATPTAGANAITFSATSGTKTITTAGKVCNFPLVFNGVGGTWQLVDNLTMATNRSFTLTNGTFNANNKDLLIGSYVMGVGTKTLTLGSGRWTCLGAWNGFSNAAGLTVSASTAIIDMTSASGVSFQGGAKTWPTLNIGGAGPITIVQNNTFGNITNSVQPCTVRFTATSSNTFTNFSLAGTLGNLVTIDTSSGGSAATVSKASGAVTVPYCSIKDSTATGGAVWSATYSTNVSGNSGWFIYAGGLPVRGDPGLGGSVQSFLNYGRI